MEKIDMPSNSHEMKERQAKASTETQPTETRPVKHDIPKPKLSEGAVVKKPSMWSKVVDTFLQGRNLEDVGTYVIKNVLVPTIIDGVANTLKTAVDGICYGDARPGSASKYSNQKTNYSTSSISRPGSSSGRIVSSGGRQSSNQSTDYTARRSRGFEMIVISNRRDAEIVYDHMCDIIDKYDCVSVADYYDSFEGTINVQARFTDNDWGWFNLNDVIIRHVPGGWIIDLPDPVKLV